MMIDIEYSNSSGKINYLAEWHTHPQVHPNPRDIDLDSISEIALTSKEFAILVIIGFIDYNEESFLDQSIAIIKYKDADQFEVLDCNIY